MVGQSSSPARLPGCRSGCRALALLVLAAGCGELHFVPAPYTPQDVELVYSEQEHITIVRWRVSAAAPISNTRFEILGPDGYLPVDFSTSVYAGGMNACTGRKGTCAQYVVRGKYAVEKDQRPVRAVNDAFGVLPGGVATTRTVSETFSFQSYFRPRNDMVYVSNLADEVADAGPYTFPRPYERTMWPTSGLCVADLLPGDVSFLPLDDTRGFPPVTPLTAAGTYCVAARPVPTDGGDAAIVQVRIATVPEVVTKTQVFEPPIERSPIIYQMVLDLEIPVPDRCEDVIQKLEDWTQRYLTGGGAPVHKLPTINLAQNATSRCAQTNDRTVAATETAQNIKQLITTLTGENQLVHLMYFNNLDAPLPMPLTTSMQSLFDALGNSPPGYKMQTLSWVFNPGFGAGPPLVWWATWIWISADEMFAANLQDYAKRSLPYTTQFHDPNEPVLLLSAGDETTYEGHLVKICTASPFVQAVGTQPVRHFINEPSWKISVADPPAYLVSLSNQLTVPAASFVKSDAIVNYQICTRYCDGHPYVTDNGAGALSWSESFTCAKKDY
jgi:hypothetical protein